MSEQKSKGTLAEARVEPHIEDNGRFNNHEMLQQYLEQLGITDQTPKTILYAFKDGLDIPIWEDKAMKYISDQCSVSELLERIGDIGVFMADEPNDFTVGLVLRLDDNRQLAIRYILEECELTEPDGRVPEGAEPEFDYVAEYETVICEDYHKLLWTARSLAETT
jgi:hypothetical protein